MAMSWHKAVLNIVICTLLFLAGFMWAAYIIFFGGEAYKRLVLKVVMISVAIVLVGMAIKFAGENESCIAALITVYALLMALGAVFAL